MTTSSKSEVARRQSAWLSFAAAVVALGGMLVPAIRDPFPFGAMATIVFGALLLLVFAPVLALRRGTSMPPGFFALDGLLLGPLLALFFMSTTPLPAIAVAWAVAVYALIGASVLRWVLPVRKVPAAE